ncbi:hypothetical protein COCMIDRAFT_24791 [Bipolaris oryzae ATCC 44560]|uniref:Uncharacterized protein n=1 Tax=Bipolaris oryzae ATCC 44560 TaxID=930090 RepID=W6ZUC6_COCMI|nr:uncharacterized protein COCMIDRAFT_24791 [Bipolaris oryzae ATCC 44560]EUC47311.1 hypothetical protein COCMIDRAFT_24791 [Bipolaris oryzae ATCC 44560]
MSKFAPDNPESLKRAILRRAKDNSYKVGRIAALDYGWEAWVQADLGCYLSVEADTTEAVLQREEYPYGDGRRVDLGIYGPENIPWHWIEIKTQTPSQGKQDFLDNLMADWAKLDDVVVGQHHARLWAVGFWQSDGQGKPKGFANWDFEVANGMNVLYRTKYNPKFSKL